MADSRIISCGFLAYFRILRGLASSLIALIQSDLMAGREGVVDIRSREDAKARSSIVNAESAGAWMVSSFRGRSSISMV